MKLLSCFVFSKLNSFYFYTLCEDRIFAVGSVINLTVARCRPRGARRGVQEGQRGKHASPTAIPFFGIFVCAHLQLRRHCRLRIPSPCLAAATPPANAVPLAPAAPAARKFSSLLERENSASDDVFYLLWDFVGEIRSLRNEVGSVTADLFRLLCALLNIRFGDRLELSSGFSCLWREILWSGTWLMEHLML